MKFYKYQGTGNDFVMIDNRNQEFVGTQKDIADICHRRFGVGADGLILIEDLEGYDFRMRYYNADGAEGSMCGNGGRCAVQFASDLGIFSNEARFMAIDGEHKSKIENGMVFLQMIDVDSIKNEEEGYFLNTGSPHLIIFKEDLNQLDIKKLGSAIRYSDYWQGKGGVNVNFVQIIDKDTIKVRTYERGVEDETFSCGTGVTAAAIASSIKKQTSKKLKIETLGGTLYVSLKGNDKLTDIILSGPAKKVFEGFL